MSGPLIAAHSCRRLRRKADDLAAMAVRTGQAAIEPVACGLSVRDAASWLRSLGGEAAGSGAACPLAAPAARRPCPRIEAS